MTKNIDSQFLLPSRRAFIKKMAVGAISVFSPLVKPFLPKSVERLKKRQMYYRRLGRTGFLISEICLGGSPLPDQPLLLQAVERGVNYIDTSCTYSNGNSERQIGRLFKEIGRDKIHVGTKFYLRGDNWNEESILKSVDGSLQRLQTDYVDVLLIHGAEREDHLTDERTLNAYEKLKKQGKFRFKGLSCHSNHDRVIKKAIECGHYDMVMFGYNVFDIQEKEKEIKVYDDYLGESGTSNLINFAASRDVGIIAMKTLKVGGRRQNLEKYRTGTTSIYQAMLKWALENKNIAAVATEMLNYRQLEEDLGVVGMSLTKAERANLCRFVAENSKDYCHLCGRCQNSCPSQIQTSTILRCLAYYESYGKKDRARELYAGLRPEQRASSCQDCGECERACPYGVQIRNRIRDAHTLLLS